MKSKILPFNCQDNACRRLAEVLIHYAKAAFPNGGSECAQASREALENIAQQLQQSFDTCEIKARQRAMLKNAIEWYFSEIEQNTADKERLLAQLKQR